MVEKLRWEPNIKGDKEAGKRVGSLGDLVMELKGKVLKSGLDF